MSVEKIACVFKEGFDSALSCVKILLKSSFFTKSFPAANTNSVLIMGNGPSLRTFLETKADFLEGKDLLAVNYAVSSDYFVKLKPRYYVAIDPVVFNNEEFCRRLFEPLASKTSWTLDLFVPLSERGASLWREIIGSNKNIKVNYINTTPIKGLRSVSRLIFANRLGMPSPRNVLVPSLMVSLWMGYKNIYTAGVEHTWHNQLWVDDNNELMIDDTHYYDNSQKGYSRHGNFNVSMLFRSLSLAFGSYIEIDDFARFRGSKIYNVTEGSYIDAFERFKV